MSPLRLLIIIGLILSATGVATGQMVKVSGQVFDRSQSIPLAGVSVMSTGGTGTATDSLGHYTIYTHENDSVWFSYLGKPTPKYPVRTIPNLQKFEIALHVNVTELKQVMVKPPNYHLDSLRNREEYAKAFNFEKPGIGISMNDEGAGLDLDEFINMFRFRRNHRMMVLKERLIQEEQEKFIDHRFSRALVIRITHLKSPELDTFMVRYRPDLIFTKIATEYEFQLYIKKSFEKYERLKKIMSELKKEEEN